MESKTITFIRNNWVFITCIVAIIGQWGFLTTTVKDHEKRISALEDYRESEVLVLTDIQSRLASIETSILFIKERVK